MDVGTAAYLLRGWIGGFIAAYVVYFILIRFVFNKMEAVKAYRISLALVAVLLIMVSDYSVPEALLFYTPALLNIYIFETLRYTRKSCPGCQRRVKKDARTCKYCGKVLAAG
ncbi:MAG: zinc ribbon domain-containing protein [Firmicutes bacterium]|nr:zinc ribbon domain-containing protein [Bacillota bacterium]